MIFPANTPSNFYVICTFLNWFAAALLFALGPKAWRGSHLAVLLMANVIAVGMASFVNNLSDRRQYPTFWGSWRIDLHNTYILARRLGNKCDEMPWSKRHSVRELLVWQQHETILTNATTSYYPPPYHKNSTCIHSKSISFSLTSDLTSLGSMA